MRLFANADIPGFQRANIRTRNHVAVPQNLHPSPETFLPIRDVEGLLQFVLYRKIWRNDENAPLRNAKWQDCCEPRFPASNRQLNNGKLFCRAEELVSAQICFALWVSEVRVVFDICGRFH